MNEISNLLGAFHPALASLHGGPLVIFLLVALSTLIYLLGYLIKGIQVGRQLSFVLKAVKALRNKSQRWIRSVVIEGFNDPMQRRDLADALRSMGFKWANSRLAWYLPEG